MQHEDPTISNQKRAIELLGGCCKQCGWAGHQAGFDFHHVSGKDFSIGNVANRRWDLICAELERCVLLCAICHRIEHSTREDPRLVEEAEKYGDHRSTRLKTR